MPPSPTRIHWKGLPHYCLPRIRIVSTTSIIHDSPAFAARDVFRSPLGEAFERTRQLQQMRARRHRIARSQATFPNLAIYRRSVGGDRRVVTTNSGRQIIFPHRRSEGRRSSSRSRRRQSSSRSNRRTSSQSRQSGRSRQSRHVRRLTAQQKLIHSRRSLRRVVSSIRGEPRRSTSSRSSPRRSTSSRSIRSSPRLSTSSRGTVLFREPSTRSVPAATRLPRIQIHKSRSLKSRTPGPRLASPAPYWGAIPSPIPTARRTPLDKQTFVSRRVGGKYVHKALPPLKQSSNDVLHRGLSNSSSYSRKSRIYDKRLPVRKGPAETVNGFIILPDAKPELPLLFPSSLDFAKLDGSSARSPSTSSSSSRSRMYPDEDSSSNIANVDVASRTTSEARALDDFTQGLQQHLQATYAEGPRPRSPSVAQTIVSTHTLQDLVAFREEFKAAGLAVTSRDQKGARSQRQSERSTPPKDRSTPPKTKVRVQQSRVAAARRPSIVAASAIAPPQATYSTLNVPLGVELKSPRSVSPLVPGRNPALIAVRSSIDQSSSIAERSKIPIPKEKASLPKTDKPSPKKPLPWLKNPGQLPPGQESLSAFNLRSEAPSRATNNSSVTTIIDFSPHPSEFWDKQGLDFNDFQSRHPNLIMNRNALPDFDDPPYGGGIIMLENEIKQPMAVVEPREPSPEPPVIIHDKSGPPKPLRIEVREASRIPHGGSGHRAPSPLQTQLFPEDIDPDPGMGLVRADSFESSYDKASQHTQGLPTIPDFSSFATSSGSASATRRRSSGTRPKSEGDEREDVPRPVGRRASKEEIWAEKRRRSKEDLLRQARGLGQYDEQRTKFEIKKVTPWELNSESTDTGDTRHKKNKSSGDDHPQIEIIGSKSELSSTPRSEKPDGMDGADKERKGLFGGHGLRSKMRALFGADRESRSSNEEEIPAAAQSAPSLPTLPPSDSQRPRSSPKGKEKEKETKQTIVVPECEECQNPHSGSLATGRPSSLNEPKSARSFQEWQAGVPFKPLSRESSVNDHTPEEILPCGHRKRHAPLSGDPVKRNVAARRTKGPPSIRGSRAPSIFTIQETVPKAAPKIAPPPSSQPTVKKHVVMSASESSSEISDGEVLKGLGIVLEGVLNSDVEAWIKEATGTHVRKFLGDLAALDKLGTGALTDKARRNFSKRSRAMERLGSHRKGRSEGSVL